MHSPSIVFEKLSFCLFCLVLPTSRRHKSPLWRSSMSWKPVLPWWDEFSVCRCRPQLVMVVLHGHSNQKLQQVESWLTCYSAEQGLHHQLQSKTAVLEFVLWITEYRNSCFNLIVFLIKLSSVVVLSCFPSSWLYIAVVAVSVWDSWPVTHLQNGIRRMLLCYFYFPCSFHLVVCCWLAVCCCCGGLQCSETSVKLCLHSWTTNCLTSCSPRWWKPCLYFLVDLTAEQSFLLHFFQVYFKSIACSAL